MKPTNQHSFIARLNWKLIGKKLSIWLLLSKKIIIKNANLTKIQHLDLVTHFSNIFFSWHWRVYDKGKAIKGLRMSRITRSSSRWCFQSMHFSNHVWQSPIFILWKLCYIFNVLIIHNMDKRAVKNFFDQ